MATALYTVYVESGADHLDVTITLHGGSTAHNTARAVASAIARTNVGAVVAVLRGTRVVERYQAETYSETRVRKVTWKRPRTKPDGLP